jgi:hypothetical protein
LSGVVKREVVVDADAHAAGPAVTNARALNSTGINRLRDTCLVEIRRLSATMGECVMGFQAPVRTVSSLAFILRKRTPDKEGSNSSQRSY